MSEVLPTPGQINWAGPLNTVLGDIDTRVAIVEGKVTRNVVTKTTTYAIAANDFVLANGVSGGFTVTLPSPISGAVASVKKIDASGNTITVSAGSALVDGSSSTLITVQWASLDFISDGTNWYVR